MSIFTHGTAPTLVSAWRDKSDVQRPRLPDQVFVFAKPALSTFAVAFTKLDDNLAARVLILVVGVCVNLAHKVVDALFDERLQVDVLDPGYRNVEHVMRGGFEILEFAIPEDGVQDSGEDFFVGLVGEDVDGE